MRSEERPRQQGYKAYNIKPTGDKPTGLEMIVVILRRRFLCHFMYHTLGWLMESPVLIADCKLFNHMVVEASMVSYVVPEISTRLKDLGMERVGGSEGQRRSSWHCVRARVLRSRLTKQPTRHDQDTLCQQRCQRLSVSIQSTMIASNNFTFVNPILSSATTFAHIQP